MKTLQNTCITWIALFLYLLPLNSIADSPSYNFVSFEYANRNIDDLPLSGLQGDGEKSTSFDGFSLAGSIEIGGNWFAELRHLKIKGKEIAWPGRTSPASSFFGAPAGAVTGTLEGQTAHEAIATSASIGYQIRQNENSSTFIALGIASAEVDLHYQVEWVFKDSAGNVVPQNPGTWQGFSQSLSASDSGAIISAGYRTNLGDQIELGVRVDNVYLDDSSISLTGELLYKIANSFAMQVAAEVAEDENQISAGLRYMF